MTSGGGKFGSFPKRHVRAGRRAARPARVNFSKALVRAVGVLLSQRFFLPLAAKGTLLLCTRKVTLPLLALEVAVTCAGALDWFG
jgi:hypothetical protein